jgi:hypothetical protein
MPLQNTLPGQLASQAEFIVNNLQQTDYQYTENINFDAGIFDCDCNSFVGFVLQGLAPVHYQMIQPEAGQLRPRAYIYYKFFSLLPPGTTGWNSVASLPEARRGDIIAWELPGFLPTQDTGHVLFVAETPKADDSGIFWVRVYDSADKPHFDDTRGAGKPFENGVGSGFIQFKVDGTGAPISFLFAPSDDPNVPFASAPIAIGRVEPLQGS